MPGRHRFLIALVVPGRLLSEINGLRRALNPDELVRIPPHLTLVPPLNVRADVPPLIEYLHEVAAESGPIRVGLGPPATFAPRAPIVYLAVTGDLVALAKLEARLTSGPLQPPAQREQREFVPHVTIASRLSAAAIAAAVDILAPFRAAVTFSTLTLFEQPVGSRDRRWHTAAEIELGRPTIVGRGGRELTFHLGERPDPASEAFLSEEWGAYIDRLNGPDVAPDRRFALSVWNDGNVVGVITGHVRSNSCNLDQFVVAPTERSTGIGGQLLTQIERFAREWGCVRIRLRTAENEQVERLYLNHGYLRVATLVDWRPGMNFVILERAL